MATISRGDTTPSDSVLRSQLDLSEMKEYLQAWMAFEARKHMHAPTILRRSSLPRASTCAGRDLGVRAGCTNDDAEFKTTSKSGRNACAFHMRVYCFSLERCES